MSLATALTAWTYSRDDGFTEESIAYKARYKAGRSVKDLVYTWKLLSRNHTRISCPLTATDDSRCGVAHARELMLNDVDACYQRPKLFVLNLAAGKGQTDGQTDGRTYMVQCVMRPVRGRAA